MSTESEPLALPEETKDSNTLRVIGWFSAGMALATLGIYLGFELRSRYKVKRLTPYDVDANARENHASEFGMGI